MSHNSKKAQRIWATIKSSVGLILLKMVMPAIPPQITVCSFHLPIGLNVWRRLFNDVFVYVSQMHKIDLLI